MAILSIKLDVNDEVLNSLALLEKETGKNKTLFIAEAITNYLQELKEDKEDYKEAEKAWQEFVDSEEKTYTIDEVRKEVYK